MLHTLRQPCTPSTLSRPTCISNTHEGNKNITPLSNIIAGEDSGTNHCSSVVAIDPLSSQHARMEELKLLKSRGITRQKSSGLSCEFQSDLDLTYASPNFLKETRKTNLDSMSYLRNPSSSQQAKVEQQARMKELQLLNLKDITGRKSNTNAMFPSLKVEGGAKKIIHVESLDYLRKSSSSEQAKMEHQARMEELKRLGLKGITKQKSVKLADGEGISDVNSFYSSQKCLKEAMKKHYNESMEYLHRFQNNEVSSRKLKSPRSNNCNLTHDAHEDPISESPVSSSDGVVEIDPFGLSVEQPASFISDSSKEVMKDDDLNEKGDCDNVKSEEKDDQGMYEYNHNRIDEHVTDIIGVVDCFVDSITETQQGNSVEAIINKSEEEKKCDDSSAEGTQESDADIKCLESPTSVNSAVTTLSSDINIKEDVIVESIASDKSKRLKEKGIVRSKRVEKGNEKTRQIPKPSSPTRKVSKNTIFSSPRGSLVRSPNSPKSKTAENSPRKTRRIGPKLGFVNVISPYSSDRNTSARSNNATGTKKRFNSEELATVALCISSLKNGFRNNRKRMFSKSVTKCTLKWEPKKHKELSGCEVCLSFANGKELAAYHAKGYHHRIMMTRGGCCKSCKVFPRNDSQSAPRICQRCFHDTHKVYNGEVL